MACALASDLEPMACVKTLRDRFSGMLQRHFGDRVVLTGYPAERLPGTLNLSFRGMVGAEALQRLDGDECSPVWGAGPAGM